MEAQKLRRSYDHRYRSKPGRAVAGSEPTIFLETAIKECAAL